MSVTLVVFRQICVMALLIAIGWVLARRGILTAQGNAQLSTVLTGCVIPAVIFSAFVTLKANRENLRLLGMATALCLASYGFGMAAAALLFRTKGGADAHTAVSRACTVFTNNGFFGLPVVQALFGEIGVFYASVNVMCSNVLLWTWGSAQFHRGQKARLRGLLTQPACVAALAGLAVFALRLWPTSAAVLAAPGLQHVLLPLQSVLEALRALNTPLAMLVLGVNIFQAHWKLDAGLLRVLPLAGLRQVVLPLVWLLLTRCLPLPPTLLFSVYIEAACPVAMLVSVMALRYHAPQPEQERATRTVVVSTLSALLTVPLMVALGSLLLAV